MSKRISKHDLVNSLKSMWTDFYAKKTYLKSVAILNAEPLKGIKNSHLSLSFPLTVICGINGTGKSTFLSLSILAFHAEKPPFYVRANDNSPLQNSKDLKSALPKDVVPKQVSVMYGNAIFTSTSSATKMI